MFVSLVGSLLSWLHGYVGPRICPGDWAWTVTALGALVAGLPVAGVLLVALIRQFTGNRLSLGTVATFAAIGVSSSLLLPWVIFSGAANVFQSAALGFVPPGMNSAELASLGGRYCFVVRQREYLGDGTVAGATVFSPGSGWLGSALHVLTVVVVPAISVFAMIFIGRAAFRRGPRWPSRFFWVSFVLLPVVTAHLTTSVLAHLWLGFVPASLLGVLVTRLVPPPSWAAINRASERHKPEPEADDAAEPPQQPLPPVARPGAAAPAPTKVDFSRQPAPRDRTAVEHLADEGQHRPPALPGFGAQPVPVESAALAADPGPLPFLLAGRADPAVPASAPVTGPGGHTTPVGPPIAGRFRRLRRLGHGGMGTVWLAEDTQLGRTVAVKLSHAPDEETTQRILREARALAAVRHPNCVRVYDIVEDRGSDGGLAIVMEYIEGSSLSEEVRSQGTLDDVAAGRLWLTMAGALAAAHEKGVLHRDVKPSNIILDPEGTAHLIDFGIARQEGDSTLTATGMMLGTPDYLAPETAAGRAATPASDAWQLAAAVNFTLTGQPPRGVRDSTISSLMAAAQAQPAVLLPQHSLHRALLGAAMHPDPFRRPPLAVVQRELGGWLSRVGLPSEGPITAVLRRAETADRSAR